MSDLGSRSVDDARPLSEIVNLETVHQLGGAFEAAQPPEDRMSLNVNIGATETHIEDEVLAVRVPFRLTVVRGSDMPSDPEPDDGDSSPTVLLSVDAAFMLTYSMATGDEEIDESAVTAFASTNAVFNAWPYWREYVGTSISRATYPHLVVPVLRIEGGRLVMGGSG